MKQESEELSFELGSSDSEVDNIRSTGLQTVETVESKDMYHTSPVTSKYSKVRYHLPSVLCTMVIGKIRYSP
jgi:hypothetical protein